jgi:hypothetical protein
MILGFELVLFGFESLSQLFGGLHAGWLCRGRARPADEGFGLRVPGRQRERAAPGALRDLSIAPITRPSRLNARATRIPGVR